MIFGAEEYTGQKIRLLKHHLQGVKISKNVKELTVSQKPEIMKKMRISR